MVVVPGADLAQDRERRIVDDDAAFRVLGRLVVSARVKGPKDLRAAEIVPGHRPVAHGSVNVGRRVAVVRGQLRLEFLHEGVVLLGAFAFLFPEVAGLVAQGQGSLVEAGQLQRHAGAAQGLQLAGDELLVPGA